MDPSIKVYRIGPTTKKIEHIRFDSRMALLLAGSVIVYDRVDDTFKMIASPSDENITQAAEELVKEREKRAKWRDVKVARSIRG